MGRIWSWIARDSETIFILNTTAKAAGSQLRNDTRISTLQWDTDVVAASTATRKKIPSSQLEHDTIGRRNSTRSMRQVVLILSRLRAWTMSHNLIGDELEQRDYVHRQRIFHRRVKYIFASSSDFGLRIWQSNNVSPGQQTLTCTRMETLACPY